MRKKQRWSFDTWDVGHIRENAGPRFIVYRPDYPKADEAGRAYRAHVVWWLTHKRIPPKGHVIHHINEDTLDDKPGNLLLMTAKAHSAHHHEKNPPATLKCEHCRMEFTVQFNIISQHLKEGRKHGQRFCSKGCADDFRRGKRAKSYRGLTEAKVRQIKAILATKDRHRVAKAAAKFGISKSAVYAIKYGENWSDVK